MKEIPDATVLAANPSAAAEAVDRLRQPSTHTISRRSSPASTPRFVNDTPAHPDRSFSGAAQVRENWARIFAGVPDLQARIVGQTVDDTAAWTEWDWTGTRRDGSSHHMRGVTITTVGTEAITGARFFMEPVTDDGLGVAAAIDRVTGGVGGRSAAGSAGVIAIAGGTGRLGRLVAADLASRGERVRALTRDPSRVSAELVTASRSCARTCAIPRA